MAPVVLIIFNRPRLTAQVFERVRAARPSRLFVIADGPREDRPGEAGLCEAARKIVSAPDWPCELHTNFSEKNLGCRRRIPSGISWVFEHCSEAIILEDDCVPSLSFFDFCSTLLDRYRDDTRIMSIGGANFQLGHRRGSASYYFAGYTHIWGWATWKRAWLHNDADLKLWPEARKEDWLSQVLTNPLEKQYWTEMIEKVYRGEIDCWGYQWLFSCWMQGGLTVVPNQNLVTNLGVGMDATHTKADCKALGIPATEIGECIHPQAVIRNTAADRFHWEEHILAEIEQEKRKHRWPNKMRKLLGVRTRIRGLAAKVSHGRELAADRAWAEAKFRQIHGKPLSFSSPKTFNEKIRWSLVYARSREITELADKYAVREYVTTRVGSRYLIPLLGVYANASEINFNALPQRFVLKATHGSGWTVICKDKSALDISATRVKLDGWLVENFHDVSREWQYKNIPPRIVCEEFIQGPDDEAPWDYQFFCFSGKPHSVHVHAGRHGNYTVDIFDMSWRKLPVTYKGFSGFNGNIPKPDMFEEMVELCRKLAGDIPMVRVDLYCVQGRIYFGEMTFSPGGGFTAFVPEAYDYELGRLWKLPQK